MSIKNFSHLRALIAGLGLILAGRVTAQTFTALYSFTGGSDGDNPEDGLILSGDTLYGTTADGGNSGYGNVFALNTNGTGFTNLYSFTTISRLYPYTNSDGAFPLGLILAGTTLCGTTDSGGIAGNGTVFAVNTNGTGFTVLHSFTATSASTSYYIQGTNTDGANPFGGLTLSGNTLYGTAKSGGSGGTGTVFAVNTNGTGFTTLYSFTVMDTNTGANSDGAFPNAELILAGSTLYGTASSGGSFYTTHSFGGVGNGTVFAVNTNGTGFTNLHSFNSSTDGGGPNTGLILSGNTLYGTAGEGGIAGHGTVFALNTNGTGFTTLYSFTGGSDGSEPKAGLILSGDTLYGTARFGGSLGNGTVFALNTNGTGFTTLYDFTGGIDGADPALYAYPGVVASGSTLYGMTDDGGSDGNGTVFSISLPPVSGPQPAILLSGSNVILTWTNTATDFTLQSTTNLLTARWSTVFPGPTVVNGQNTVTNQISGIQQFYRLSQ